MLKKVGLVLPVKTSFVSLPFLFSAVSDDLDLQPLKNNIEKNGILSPLLIRETNKNRYEVICGKRRLICAKVLGLKTVPCIKVQVDGVTAKIMSLSETVSAQPPDYFTVAAALSDLIVNSGEDADDLRRRLGLSESYLSAKLDLLKLSDAVRRRITSAGLTEKQAAELLRLPPESRMEALDGVIAKQLGEKATAEYVTGLLFPEKEPPKPLRKAAIGDLKLFSNSLSKMLSTLNFAGYEPSVKTNETATYIDYVIRLNKKPAEAQYFQLPLC